MQDILDEMIGVASRHADPHRASAILSRVRIRVSPRVGPLGVSLHGPILYLVLQGTKLMAIGSRVLRYDPACCFVGALDLLTSGEIADATPRRPFMAVSLRLDIDALADLSRDPFPPTPLTDDPVAGYATAPMTSVLLDPWCRLLRLLDEPQNAPALAPLFEREILYRLMHEPHGAALRQLTQMDSQLSGIRRAIGWIRRHYDQPLKVGDLADIAGMSPASLHRHFRAATGTSPLQYQKGVRLQQARLRLLAGAEAAAGAGLAVGYGSPSQFSREYARMFGAPPSRDRRRLLLEGG